MYDFILLHLTWFWVAVLVLCVLIEAFTFALTTVWAAISALVMVFLSRTLMPFKWQLVIFFALTIILVVFTRPFAVKKLKIGKNKTNVDSLVGQEVLVVKAVTEFEKGEVKTKNGVVWNAKASNGQTIPKNSKCRITAVNGNTLEIEPV